MDIGGRTIPVTPKQLYDLAIFGYSKIVEDETKKTVEEPKELTIEDQVVALQNEIRSLRQEKEQEKTVHGINNFLTNATQKYDMTKEDPELAREINIEVMALYNMNPNQDLDSLYKQSYERKVKLISKYTDKVKKSAIASDKLEQFVDTPPRFKGTSSLLKEGEKLKGESLSNGVARKVFLDLVKGV